MHKYFLLRVWFISYCLMVFWKAAVLIVYLYFMNKLLFIRNDLLTKYFIFKSILSTSPILCLCYFITNVLVLRICKLHRSCSCVFTVFLSFFFPYLFTYKIYLRKDVSSPGCTWTFYIAADKLDFPIHLPPLPKR